MTLVDAVRKRDLGAAAQAIRAGADVNRLAPDALTPLMIAAAHGQYQMVELLLHAGAQVVAVEPRAGATALHKAVLSGNPDVVGLLLDHGAFIDQQSPILGHTALMDAIIYEHTDVVRLLLRRGARTAIYNTWCESPLDIARRVGLDAIAALIEARQRADMAAIEAQPLVAAIRNGNLAEVNRLIAAGVDVDARVPVTGTPEDDYTPLAIAARDGHADIVRALLRAGANPRRVIGVYLGTALHDACYFGHNDVVRAMTDSALTMAQASELDAQGAHNGMTPLHDAAWNGHIDTARVLVQAGHPLHLRTHAGLTARDLALRYGYEELARFLAEAERQEGEEATGHHAARQ